MKKARKLSLKVEELQIESFETAEKAQVKGTVHGNELWAGDGPTVVDWTCPKYDTCQCGSVYNYPGSCIEKDTLCAW